MKMKIISVCIASVYIVLFYVEEDEIEHVDQIFNALVKCINSHKLSAHGRDCVLELIIRNITSDQGLAWTRKFLETDGRVRHSHE